MGVDFDSNNNFFLFSRSSSNDASLPMHNPGGGAYYDNTIDGKYDLGLSKFSSAGLLVWSTYYGGLGLEGLSYSNVTVNESDEVIFTSQTTSTGINTYNQGGGAYYQGTPPTHLDDGWAGNSTGFFIKFANTGVLQHATYVGRDNEMGYIQDNQAGYCDRHYIILQSKTFPTTNLSGSYNVSNAISSEYNYMLVEFEADLSIRWASYLHSDSIYITRSAADLNNGRLYCTGTTRATDFITLDPGTPAYFDDALTSWSGTGSPLVHAIMEFDIGNAPIISVSGGGPDTICQGDNITLVATGSGTINWYDVPSGGVPIGTGSNFTLTNLMNDTVIYVESVVGGCASARDSIVITVLLSADATILSAGPYCISQAPQTLTAVDPGGTWSGTGVNSSGVFDPSSAGIGQHEIIYTIADPCGDADTITIEVVDNYDATITAAGPFCDNETAVQLTAVDGGGSWTGTGVSSSGLFDPSAAGQGSYEIIYTIPDPCGDADTIDIVVNESPDLTLTATDESCTGAADGQILSTVSGGSIPYTYLWSTGAVTQNLLNIGEGTYVLTVTDANGCMAEETAVLIDPLIPCDSLDPHIVIPNIFSPNVDGENDVLYVRGSGVETLLFIVYDRWGEKVFESSSLDNGWDGTYRGRAMDAAVFVYYIKARFINGEEQTLKGNVTLIR